MGTSDVVAAYDLNCSSNRSNRRAMFKKIGIIKRCKELSSRSELGLANGDFVSLGGAEDSIILPLIVRTQTPSGVALVYTGSSALGASINPHDVPESASLARVESEPSVHPTGLGLSNLVVNDAYSGAH